MPDEIERKGLSDVEIALADAVKTILEIIMHAHPGAEKYFARAFGQQRDKKLETAQPDAAAVFEILRQFVADPTRQEAREQLAKFFSEAPMGQA